jgi:predicted permease
VLAFTLILSLLTGLVFGVVPAWQISRANLNESLKSSARTDSAGAGGHRLRDVLVVSEMVLATVLLVAAGLLIRSLHKAQDTGPGFNTNQITLAAFDLSGNGYSDDRAVDYYDHLLERIRAYPGIESASLERYVPLWFTGRGYSTTRIEGQTPKPNEDMGVDLNAVGPDYFRAMQIPLIAGREFTEQDRAGAPKVLIVNQSMANRFWPNQDATGHRVHIWGDWRTVVGVVRDVKYHRMNEPPESFIYMPELQADGTDANILVRSQLPPAAVISDIRAAAKSLDPKVQPLETDSLDRLLQLSMFANRTAASLASVLGILGTLLAALGIYGVLSYGVSQRIREIGIRIALGAQRGHVLRLIVGRGLRLAVLGAAVGVIAAAAITHWMSSLLFGVSATDPLTFAVVLLLVTAVAALAAYIPARRAMRVDPVVALRYE